MLFEIVVVFKTLWKSEQKKRFAYIENESKNPLKSTNSSISYKYRYVTAGTTNFEI